jgi:hypothetical protein
MTLATDEFIRRFLIHVLPTGFHRIRHYGLFASGARAHNIAHARELLADIPVPRRAQSWSKLPIVPAFDLLLPKVPVARPAFVTWIRAVTLRGYSFSRHLDFGHKAGVHIS